ncbi:histidine kinase [uncultured Croceitalea sp.]|uniref:sensor histidine kinase n=1 Tax=uncultured Croceitalea sp. TaxID=1798908 RepID=UPI0033065084
MSSEYIGTCFIMATKYSIILIVGKHFIIWVLLILFLTISPLQWGWTISPKHSTLIPQIYGAVTNAIIFYSTAFYLIPNFFNRNRKYRFWFYAAIALIIITLIETLIDSYLGKYVYVDKAYALKVFEGLEHKEILSSEISLLNYITGGFIYAALINASYFIIAFAYRFPIDKQLNTQREHQLVQEKLSAELQFLRAQVHPHTLFNGMNSIYHLIDTQPDKAKNTLLYLSNSLRYHLYDSQEAYVSLDKEIVYLREYIKLYQIRNENEVKSFVDIEEFEDDYKIAPLLFTPFVENAFKYVSRFPKVDRNTIDLVLKMSEDTLCFKCINTIDKFPIPETTQGIGLKNVKKRLELIYSDLHSLVIEKGATTFSVYLEIKLKT